MQRKVCNFVNDIKTYGAEKMTILEKLEWAYHTIDEQLKFGLPEEHAIKARERRLKGVLLDVINELKDAEKQYLECKKPSAQ
jgi:hypothetical protein